MADKIRKDFDGKPRCVNCGQVMINVIERTQGDSAPTSHVWQCVLCDISVPVSEWPPIVTEPDPQTACF